MSIESAPEKFWFWAAVAVTVGMAAVGALADTLLKKASLETHYIINRWFLAGAVIHGMTAFGWVWVMRNLKLAVLGVVYSLSTVVLLTLVGALFFHETLTAREWLGLGLAVLSMLLLSRFA